MASPAHPSFVIGFGEFELIAASGGVPKAGLPLKIHPQPFRVLLLLAERHGQLVTRDEIRRFLWGDNTLVDFEGGINFCIKQIRDVLSDDAENPRYLQTIPRRGYRFIAAVSFIEPVKHPIQFVPLPGPTAVANRSSDVKVVARETEPERSGVPAGALLLETRPDRKNWSRVALSGKLKLLLNNAQRQWMTRPLPSPDGRFLTFQGQTSDANVWLLGNF